MKDLNITKNLNPDEIYIEADFNINLTPESVHLRSSIEQFGILSPLICFYNKGRIYVVDGYKRLDIAAELSLKSVPVTILDSSLDPSDIAKIRLFSLIYDSEPNIYQKIALYHFLVKNSVPPPELDTWRKRLNLPHDKSQMAKINRILLWPEPFLRYINKYNATYRQLRPLLDKSETELSPIFDIGFQLSVRLVELINISELVFESALNKNTGIKKILNHESVRVVLSNDRLTKSQKTQHLKNALYSLRYPTISQHRDKTLQKIKEIDLPSGAQIKFDKSFESEGVQLIINIKHVNDFRTSLSQLDTDKNHKLMKELLDIL
ncbi:MAG: ParB N-terminal domain-containing protein [Calditrichaceae bacterium]